MLHAYARLPVRWRFGPAYWQTKKLLGELGESESWDREKLERWQLRRLQEIVNAAWRDVPGYRRLWSAVGFEAGALQSLEDFRRLPPVTKAQLSENLAEFTSVRVPKWRRIYRTTAGSTGIPFGFYLNSDAVDREWAFMHTAWEGVGWRFGDRSAVLRGAWVGSREHFWSEDPHLSHLHLSTYELTAETWPAYRDRMLAYGVNHLQAYPSAAYLLADIVLDQPDMPPPNFKLILLGSENLYEFQRERISRAFPNARLVSWYGHAEQAAFAPQCGTSVRLHSQPLYGFTELLGQGDLEAPEGKMGEIVATSFWNQAMPFIRYRTMDYGLRGPDLCPACGRWGLTLERIEGRLQEMIVTSTGRWISMTALNMHTNVFDTVKQFQFHQSQPGQVELRLIPKPEYGSGAERKIRSALEEKLGRDVVLRIVPVETIPKTRSGKFRFLDQELSLKYGDS
jgi:phenylacetate-coenzyme A ligase PaaK-like adenylate-forming protein